MQFAGGADLVQRDKKDRVYKVLLYVSVYSDKRK